MRPITVVLFMLVWSCADKHGEESAAPPDAAPPPVRVTGAERSPTPCACGYLWEKRFGSQTGSASPSGVTTDSSGNIVVAGSMGGIMDFGGGELTAKGADVFVAKLDREGAHLSSKRFGDDETQRAKSVAVADDGSLFVTGELRGTLDFGSAPLVSGPLPGGYPSVFVAKLDAGGNHLWSKAFAPKGTGQIALRSVAVRGSELFIAGTFRGDLDVGGGPLASGEGSIFVAKLGASGEHIWSKRFEQKGDPVSGSSGFDLGVADLRIDAQGNVLLAGTFRDTIDFGGGPLTSSAILVPNAETDSYVVKLDATGNHVWSRRVGRGRQNLVTGAAVSPAGDVFVTGYGVVGEEREEGIFIEHFDASGALGWARSFAGFFGEGPRLATDGKGRVGMTGQYFSAQNPGGVDLGCGPLARPADPHRGEPSLFVAVFDETGRCAFSKGTGTDDFRNVGTEVAYDPTGNLLVVGITQEGLIDLGGGAFTTHGGSGFLVKLGP